MSDEKIEWGPVWWSTIIVTITTVIMGGILHQADKNFINKAAYNSASNFFNAAQPDYFPLLFLFVGFFVTFAIVWVYKMLLPMLPANWIIRGLLVGAFLFLVSDLPNSLLLGYLTQIPAAASQGMALTTLLNRLINGCILTYAYMRFSPGWKSK
jgi:hypothetical protein